MSICRPRGKGGIGIVLVRPYSFEFDGILNNIQLVHITLNYEGIYRHSARKYPNYLHNIIPENESRWFNNSKMKRK